MKIYVEIDELVLYGFDNADRKGIGDAFERELTKLIRQGGLPTCNQKYELSNIDMASFNMYKSENPKTIGIKTAQSIYRTLRHL